MAASYGAKKFHRKGTPIIFLLSLILIPMCAKTTADLGNVLSSIKMLLKYYQNDYKNLNLDGFFGLRVLEGQLQLLISEHSLGRHKHLSNETLKQIFTLKEVSKNLTALGLDVVKHDDAQYFKVFNPIVSKPWKVIKPHRKLNPSLRWEIPQYKAKLRFMRKNFTEATSDKCMTEILGSDNKSCVVSDACAKLMTSRGFTGYPITHQLLWSMLVESKPKCILAVEPHLQKLGLKSINDLQQELCTNNFYEMVAVVEVLMHGNVHGSQQDLFLEQQFVCPSIGFYEFLKKDYISQIISWQFPSGCFGELEDRSEEYDSDQIDITSLLEEYNGDKLKFVPEVTINHVRTQGSSRIDVFRKHAMSIEQRESALNIKKKNGEQPKLSAEEKQSSVIVSDEKPDQSIINKIPIPKANPHIPEMKTLNKKQKDKLLFRPDGENQDSSLYQSMPEHSSKVGRHLLVEKKMTGGCLSHKTGVAAGALVMYLRYMIDPGDIKWDGQHDLLLTDTRSLLQVKGGHIDPGEYGKQEDMDSPDPDEEDDEDDMDEGAAIGFETKDEEEKNEESDVAGKIKPLPPSINEGENKEGEIPKHPVEYENDEEDDEEVQDDDVDEIDNAEEDNDYPSNEDSNMKAVYDRAGNPIAPGGRLIQDSERDNPPKQSYLEKHVDIHAGRHKIELDYEDQDEVKSVQEMQKKHREEYPQQEEEGHFYDDDIVKEEGKPNVKLNQPVPSPLPPIQPQGKGSILGTAASEALYLGGRDPSLPEQPNYTALMLVSVTPLFIVLFFLFKFVRKRRVHIRYHF